MPGLDVAVVAIIQGIVVSVAVNLILGALFKQKKDDSSPTYGIGAMQTQTNSNMVMPIIYGKVKCAGNNIWQSNTQVNKKSAEKETVDRLVGFGVGQYNRVYGVCLNNKLCSTGPVFSLHNTKYSDATASIISGGPTPEDKTLRLYANGVTTDIYLQDEADYDNGSYDYNCYIGKLIQYIKGVAGYPKTLVEQGWVVTNDVPVDTAPCKLNEACIAVYNSFEVRINSDYTVTRISDQTYIGVASTQDLNIRTYSSGEGGESAVVGTVTSNTVDNNTIFTSNSEVTKSSINAYNSPVTFNVNGLEGCSYTAYMGDGEQEIDNRVPGETQRDKALKVGGLKYDAYLAITIHSSDELGSSPNVTAIWEGRRVRVYTSPTSYTIQYTNNPAWCIVDFYMSPDGLGMDVSEIDIPSFIEAANYAQPGDGSRHWGLDLILDTKKKKQEWRAEMFLCCRAYPTYANGKHGILVEKPAATSQIFTVQPDEEFELYWSELSEDVERLFLKYIDPDYEWQTVMAPAAMPVSTFRRPTAPLDKTVEIRGITNFIHASQISWFYLNQAQTTSGWARYKTNRKALNCTIGDVIGIRDPITKIKEEGLDYKRYRILNITETQGSGIELVMREYNEHLYSDTMGSVEGIYQTGSYTPGNRVPPAITNINCYTNIYDEILVEHDVSTLASFVSYKYYYEKVTQ